MTIPHVSESLAGRIELLRMWPLAQSEIEGTNPSFLSWAFSGARPAWTSVESRNAIIERALTGGYPEVVARESKARRNAWFGSYLDAVIHREIKSISNIEDEAGIVKILRAMASRSGGPRNYQTLSSDAAIPSRTVARYVALLVSTFLVSELPAWAISIDARIIRSPKVLINDSGLYGHLLNISTLDNQVGLLLEDFVGAELLRLISFEEANEFTLMHFRTREQQEVDFVIEGTDRHIVGVETKAARTVTSDDFRGLRALAEIAGARFHRGVVIHCGDQSLPFGKNMWAIPMSALWQER